MKLTIKYFGLIAEVTHCNEEQFEIIGETVSAIKAVLFQKYPNLKQKNFQIVQNNELVNDNTKITGAEIALLPPFAGG